MRARPAVFIAAALGIAACAGSPPPGQLSAPITADSSTTATPSTTAAIPSTTIAPATIAPATIAPPTVAPTLAPTLAPATAGPATLGPATPAPETSTAGPPVPWVEPSSVGRPYGATVAGLLTFRGNPTRTYYGRGPLPRTAPRVLWRFPAAGSLCSRSTDQKGTRVWCGTGWTGQPAVWQRDGGTWMAFGSYASAVHLLDAATGERRLPDFPVGDIIKGSLTVDPDGFALLYVGSRDNYLRVLAFDRPELTELWRLSANAVSPTMWNNDWDGAPLVVGDYLFEGGENSQLHVVKLNRSTGPDGLVAVNPELVFNAPGWDGELLAAVGRNVSIESSVAISGDTLYFTNSGGLVQGWDIAPIRDGGDATRVFRYWAGDDADATVVVDEEGMLYVGVQYERETARSREVGQIIKLDPRRPDNPLVWKVDARSSAPSGIWATAALWQDLVVVATDDGDVLGIDRNTGAARWTIALSPHLWSSPVVVDGVLLIGDCGGHLRAYDLAVGAAAPTPLWEVALVGCVESTPAVWNGRIYVGTRGGAVYALG